MLDLDTTVARAVLDHSECAPVFQRHRIDYCCKGGRSIAEACRDRGLDQAAVLTELQHAIAERRGVDEPDPATLSTADLIDHVVDVHHGYLRRALPFLRPLAAKVSRVHGDHNPLLRELATTVEALADTLEPHLDAEERVLFPALRATTPDAALVGAELRTMHADHLEVGALLERMRNATEDYLLPDWACTSYRTLFAELSQLEADVHRHVHLENHVLMPRFT